MGGRGFTINVEVLYVFYMFLKRCGRNHPNNLQKNIKEVITSLIAYCNNINYNFTALLSFSGVIVI